MNDTNDDLKRRTFLGILAAAATGYAAPDAPTYPYFPGSPIPTGPSGDLSVDAIPENPNILIVMVDQLRVPLWLSSSQMSARKPRSFGLRSSSRRASLSWCTLYVSSIPMI